MPFTPPNNYTTEDKIQASSVRDNYIEAKEWIHTIENADINANSITTKHIIEPDRYYGNSFEMTSGQLYQRGTPYSYDYCEFITAHLKQSNFTAKEVAITIPNAGVKFELYRTAHVCVFINAFVNASINDVLTDAGNSNKFWIFVDDTKQGETLMYVADGNGTTSGTPTRQADGSPRIVPFNTCWFGTLSAGEHTIDLRCDPYIENCNIRGINFVLEAAYYVP
jgi:hypothetical protein